MPVLEFALPADVLGGGVPGERGRRGRPAGAAVRCGIPRGRRDRHGPVRTQPGEQLLRRGLSELVTVDVPGVRLPGNGQEPHPRGGDPAQSAREVVAAVTDAGLAEVMYRLWPLASLKGLD